MIEIDIKGKSYGSDAVLGPIKMKILPKTTLALLGPSGVGKSTFLRIICGLDHAFSGSIINNAKTSMVFQEPTLLPWRTALQNITLISGANEETAIAVLEELGLASKQDQFPNQLSVGQQRRLSLARAFAANPQFLIMDEPFTSLDKSLVDEMLKLTKKLIKTREVTTLFVTHSQREAEYLSDEIFELSGNPATLVKQKP
ncbi:MAG: ABC transporter ATP-binding protein [Hyphomicrobiales bacterium]|nr:ABC transporter ATP-binding protein [Hyphomicrobiales bacterium]PCH50888.1 MAG: ABC transporter ATP-binding protein [Hyphomicrobiales bacterium]PCH50985.1 MAG: ABC transporter ATP-binding protein [Hyphomicrobiales bacterium]